MSIPTDSTPLATGATIAKKAADFAEDKDWPGYFKVVAGKPPRDTLMRALDLFEREVGAHTDKIRFAVDLGCGEGRDTLELLRRGWRVLALDAHPEAFEYLRPRITGEARLRLQTLVAAFNEIDIPLADLVNASYALPFCEPSEFPTVWRRIERGVRPGGRFAGQFFGDRDDWARYGDRMHMTRAQVDECLKGFEIEHFEEEEKDDVTALGTMKHWHVFHVVARRK